jgi:hypothetical protein
MLKRAFTPAGGSRKCGSESWSDVGRKTTTATPAYLPPGSVCCKGALLRNGGQPPCGDCCCVESPTLNISVCLAGIAGVLGERRFCELLEGLQASDTSALCWVTVTDTVYLF